MSRLVDPSSRSGRAADPAGVQGILRVYPTPEARSDAYSYIRVLSTLDLK